MDIIYNATQNCAEYFLQDNNTGDYSTFCALNANQDYDGATSEWIVERPQVNGSLPLLADFGTVSFSENYAYNSVEGQ